MSDSALHIENFRRTREEKRGAIKNEMEVVRLNPRVTDRNRS